MNSRFSDLTPSLFALALWTLALSSPSPANLLVNPGFELGTTVPDNWTTWTPNTTSSGRWALQRSGAFAGSACVKISGNDYGLVYQSCPAQTDSGYMLEVYTKNSSGGNRIGEIHIEFKNASGAVVAQKRLQFFAQDTWTRLVLYARAPTGATHVIATLGNRNYSSILYDEANLRTVRIADLEFDVAQPVNTIHGHGIVAFADMKNGIKEFKNLNISYMRTTAQFSTIADLKLLRHVCDSLGIKMLYTVFSIPSVYCANDSPATTGTGMRLNAPLGFAKWWISHVKMLSDSGARADYIDMENEQDSRGYWSTYILPADMTILVKETRRLLDSAGFTDVGIISPNNTSMGIGYSTADAAGWSSIQEYITALDAGGRSSIYAHGTHMWGDDDVSSDGSNGCSGGADCLARYWPGFYGTARYFDSSKVFWVTEYATRQLWWMKGTQWLQYPNPDNTGFYNLSFSMRFAVRTYENTLAFYNMGANAVFYWDASDDSGSTKQWGYVDSAGNYKCIYHTLAALYPKVPSGSRVIRQISQDYALYGATFLHGDTIVVGIANDSTGPATKTVRLRNAGSELRQLEGTAVETTFEGNPALRQADRCGVTSKTLTIAKSSDSTFDFSVTMPGMSTLTVVLKRDPGTRIAGPWGWLPSGGILSGGDEAREKVVVEYFTVQGRKIDSREHGGMCSPLKFKPGVYLVRTKQDGMRPKTGTVAVVR